jgi:hypothetical protein
MGKRDAMSPVKHTSSIVANGSVNINGKTSGKVGKESNGSEGNSVHVANGERRVDNKGKDNDGDDGGLESKSNSVDHVGGSSSLATVGNLTDRGVRVRSVVLGDKTNDQTSNSSHDDTGRGSEGGEGKNGASNNVVELELVREVELSGSVDGGDHDDGGTDELNLEGSFDIGLSLDSLDVSSNEGADQANKDTNSRDNDGEAHGVPSTGNTDAASDDKSGASRFSETSEKIGSHTGDITDVVTNIVSNSGGVTRVILGDSVDDLSDQVGTDISSLGVDTSTNTAEHGNDGASKTVSGKTLSEQDPVSRGGVVDAEDKHGGVQHEHTKTAKGETHDGTGTEGGVEALSPSGLLGRDGGTDVGVDSDLHSQVATGHGGEGSEKETDGSEETAGHIPPGTPADKDEDNHRKDETKPETDGVFGAKEALGSLVDGLIDLLETLCGFFLVSVAKKTFGFAGATRFDGDFGDNQKIGQGPEEGDHPGDENQPGCGRLQASINSHDKKVRWFWLGQMPMRIGNANRHARQQSRPI